MATIRKRVLPSGRTTWLVDFKDVSGRRRAKQFATKREADAFLVNARAEVLAGVYVHESGSLTVREAATHWLAACAQRRDEGRRMERTTWAGYEAHVRLHICDPKFGIGEVKLPRLSRQIVIRFRDTLLSIGRSETTVRKILSTLKLVVQHAQENGLIVQNPIQGVRVIRSSRALERVRVPNREDIRRLIEASSEDFKPYLVVAALCGLRASEQRALRWTDVDFEEGLIRIRRRADAYNMIGEPKSSSGYRDVPMGPMVANLLKRWRLLCPVSATQLVFPTLRGGVQSHSNILKRRFKPLCRGVGVEMRWHDLRHFAVSLWIEQNFPPKAVMEFAGHSSIQMTFDLYGHLLPSPDHREAMAQVEARLLG